MQTDPIRTILVMCDDKETRKVFRSSLQKYDTEIRFIKSNISTKDLLSLMSELEIPIVLIDLNLATQVKDHIEALVINFPKVPLVLSDPEQMHVEMSVDFLRRQRSRVPKPRRATARKASHRHRPSKKR